MIQSDLQYSTMCGIIFIITTIAGFIWKFSSKNNLPPSPLALPIIGHLHLLTPIPHQAFHSLSNKYGPLMYLLLGSVPCVLASSAEIAKEFLKTHEISYADRPFSFAVDYLTYGSADFSFAPYGPYWKFMKKICMSELLGGRTLDQLLPVRREEIRRFLMLMLRKSFFSFIFLQDIFAAGTDTSAITTEWALAELINHPDMFEKAREEIDSVVGKSRLVEESDIQNLPYLQAIVKETLRLHPTGPLIVRESTEDCTIAGYDIPKKTRLFVNVWAIGRDPNHWDNPLEFLPNRFIGEEGSGKSLDVRGQHFHLLPFGSGRRGCPGISLALQVVQTTLASMIQCFEWKVGEGKNATVDMTEAPGLTLPRAHPVVCSPVARFNILPLL